MRQRRIQHRPTRQMRNIGAEGEAAFQARAIREGLTVLRSFEEAKDYDFMVDSGQLCSKVQVKSTDTLVGRTSYHLSSSHGGEAAAL